VNKVLGGVDGEKKTEGRKTLATVLLRKEKGENYDG
jgi:hypothetical protein